MPITINSYFLLIHSENACHVKSETEVAKITIAIAEAKVTASMEVEAAAKATQEYRAKAAATAPATVIVALAAHCTIVYKCIWYEQLNLPSNNASAHPYRGHFDFIYYLVFFSMAYL
jgi:hypothetical protein